MKKDKNGLMRIVEEKIISYNVFCKVCLKNMRKDEQTICIRADYREYNIAVGHFHKDCFVGWVDTALSNFDKSPIEAAYHKGFYEGAQH